MFVKLCVFFKQYKFRDVAIEELEKIHLSYPDMKTVTGTYSE